MPRHARFRLVRVRRRSIRMTRWMISAAGFTLLAAAAHQEAALKDLMPKGMVIGVALNQRQFEGVDAAAVDIITKQFNQISPENALKFQPIHPAADRYAFDVADRFVQFGVDRRMQVIGHTLVWHSQTGGWVSRGRTASLSIATLCSRACAITFAPLSGAIKAGSTAGTSSTKRLTRTDRCANRLGRWASATITSPRRSSSRARPIRAPSCTTTTSISRNR